MRRILKIQSLLGLLLLLCPASSILSADPTREVSPKQRFASETIYRMSFKSKMDATVQPFLAKTPKNYDPQKKWPLLIVLHGLGDGPILAPQIKSMLQVGPFGRGDLWYQGLGEQDVLECLEVAQTLFSVDEDQISLCGFSMGASGTFKLGLKYPHLWAACVPVCGRCDSPELLANAAHLPFWIHSGSQDKVVSPVFSRQIWQRANQLGFTHWKFTEHPNRGHSFAIDWPAVEKWLLKQKRITTPSEITFITHDPNASRAWWLEILAAQNPKTPARINAKIQGQSITLETSNVSRYQLHLADAPLDATSPITIVENGR